MAARCLRKITGIAGLVALAACTPPQENLDLLKGPPIEDVITPIDQALQCLDGKISKSLAFSVGPVPDLTGRESYNDGGAGKYISQGSSDIVQSALFKTGVTIINRRTMGIPQTEASWGLRDIKGQRPVNLFISGSVNTLDFIPGGGASLGVRGGGPRYRQNRILVGMDLAVTNASNGQVVANIPLQKQIFSDETGAFTHRFFGTTLVNMDAGVQRREALNMALRQMLYLATYELLTQLLPPEKYEACSVMISDEFGEVSGAKTSSEQLTRLQESREKAETSQADMAVAPADEVSAAQDQAPQPQSEVARTSTERSQPAATRTASTAPDTAATEEAAADEPTGPIGSDALTVLPRHRTRTSQMMVRPDLV